MNKLADKAQGTRSEIVEITDSGPAKRQFCGARMIDLSRAAFERLADRALIDVNLRKP
jgi:rare lipoprotein A (peptidoglycan hydrolase)